MKFKLIILSLLAAPSFVFAQNQALPSAGITPESNFYFLDKLGESLREFLTFNPEAKARLQITFASERIAEIKIILETKGIEAKGLEIAQDRLQAHIANAATIIEEQKASGQDVSNLAQELNNKLETPKSVLAQSFKEQERVLEQKEDELKSELKAAHRVGDTAKEESLVQELGKIKAQKELLELKEEDIEDELEDEEERLEEELEIKQEAEKAIKEAEKEKREMLDEAVEEELIIPVGSFAKFDGLLAQAKSAFVAGKFEEAKRLAKQAEKSLDAVEKIIEDLEEVKEKEEELTKKQEEKIEEEAEKEKERIEKIKEEKDDEDSELENEEDSD